jgi:hypothetical protein
MKLEQIFWFDTSAPLAKDMSYALSYTRRDASRAVCRGGNSGIQNNQSELLRL